jgi:hypothetical protein
MFAPEYVDYIQSEIVAHSINVACPRFIGHMTSELPALVQDISRLMTTLNQNTVKLETAKSLTYLAEDRWRDPGPEWCSCYTPC